MNANDCPACGRPLRREPAFSPEAAKAMRGAPLAFATVSICDNPDCKGPFRSATTMVRAKGHTHVRKIR